MFGSIPGGELNKWIIIRLNDCPPTSCFFPLYFLRNFSTGTFSWPCFLSAPVTMTCRDIHATNMFAFIFACVSVGGLAVATVIPQWRVTRLITFNRNSRNISVYDGLWTKCVKQDGYSGCYIYDSEVMKSHWLSPSLTVPDWNCLYRNYLLSFPVVLQGGRARPATPAVRSARGAHVCHPVFAPVYGGDV